VPIDERGSRCRGGRRGVWSTAVDGDLGDTLGKNVTVPEGLEVEIYRRAAETTVGRTISGVWVDDRCAPDGFDPALMGATVTGTRRVGKLLTVETDHVAFGLHFGMAGRLVVDDHAPIERLEYSSGGDRADWDRVVICFVDGGRLRVNDPRRWSRFIVTPDLDALGPDLLTLTRDDLARALGGSRRQLKAVLLDQHAIAGLGNMLVDEILWWAAVAPISTAAALSTAEIGRIHSCAAAQLPALLKRGGSHTGTLSPEVRAQVPECPRDGSPLARSQVAGRTTIWCPEHQIVVR
jgi:formamidopyrimidine-DNA glycosylase